LERQAEADPGEVEKQVNALRGPVETQAKADPDEVDKQADAL